MSLLVLSSPTLCTGGSGPGRPPTESRAGRLQSDSLKVSKKFVWKSRGGVLGEGDHVVREQVRPASRLEQEWQADHTSQISSGRYGAPLAVGAAGQGGGLARLS